MLYHAYPPEYHPKPCWSFQESYHHRSWIDKNKHTQKNNRQKENMVWICITRERGNRKSTVDHLSRELRETNHRNDFLQIFFPLKIPRKRHSYALNKQTAIWREQLQSYLADRKKRLCAENKTSTHTVKSILTRGRIEKFGVFREKCFDWMIEQSTEAASKWTFGVLWESAAWKSGYMSRRPNIPKRARLVKQEQYVITKCKYAN